MSELDDFLATTLPRQLEAERAIHNGDPEPRMAMWSTKRSSDGAWSSTERNRLG